MYGYGFNCNSFVFLLLTLLFYSFSQDTIPLHCEADVLKVHQKSDNLMFRFTVKVSILFKCITTVHWIKMSYINARVCMLLIVELKTLCIIKSKCYFI